MKFNDIKAMRFTTILPGIKIGYIVFLILLGSQLNAQTFPPIRELLADTSMSKKLPIPIASISSSIDQTLGILTEIEEYKKSLVDDVELDSILQYHNRIVIDAQEKYADERIQSTSMIILKEFQSKISQQIEGINKTSKSLKDRILQLEKYNVQIEKLIEIWDVTRNAEFNKDFSPVIRDRIRELQNEIKRIDELVDSRVNKYLEDELKLSEFNKSLNDLLKAVHAAEEQTSKNIFIPEQLPIWKQFKADGDTMIVDAEFKDVISQKRNDVINYYSYKKIEVLISSFLMIVFVIGSFIIKNHLKTFELADEENKDNIAFVIFKKPISTAVIVGIYTASFILTNKPLIVINILSLIALIPITIIFLRILPDNYDKYIVILASIYLMNLVAKEFYEFNLVKRILDMLVALSTFVWLWYMQRNKWLGFITKLHLLWFTNNLSRVFQFLLILSFFGAMLGYVELVNLFLYGILFTILITFFVYVLYLTTIGIVSYILQMNAVANNRVIVVHKQMIKRRIDNIFKFLLTVLYIYFFLRSFNVEDYLIDLLVSLSEATLSIGSFSVSILDLVNFVMVLLFARWISNFAQFILQEQVLFKSSKQKDVSASISSLVRFTIITIGFIIAVLAAGFELDKLALLISAFGVGIGFGLQNIFNNLVSGIILVFERPLQVGDTIEVGPLIGEVKSIGIRSSVVRTFDGSEVIVPNGNLISNDLINWTHSDLRRRLIVKVGVAYGTDPEVVIAKLKAVAVENPNILDNPEPYVLFKEFGDSSLDFEMRCWTENYENWIFILSDLKVRVNAVLKEAGIVIPFPQRDLHIQTVNPQIIPSVSPSKK